MRHREGREWKAKIKMEVFSERLKTKWEQPPHRWALCFVIVQILVFSSPLNTPPALQGTGNCSSRETERSHPENAIRMPIFWKTRRKTKQLSAQSSYNEGHQPHRLCHQLFKQFNLHCIFPITISSPYTPLSPQQSPLFNTSFPKNSEQKNHHVFEEGLHRENQRPR